MIFYYLRIVFYKSFHLWIKKPIYYFGILMRYHQLINRFFIKKIKKNIKFRNYFNFVSITKDQELLLQLIELRIILFYFLDIII